MCRVFVSAFVALQFVCLFVCQAGTHWVGNGTRVVTWTNSLPADQVRLGVRDAGVYRVTAGEIAVAHGLSTNDVRAALASGTVALSCGGRAVAWMYGDDALYFFGTPTTEMYAPENVYFLRVGGEGTAMESLDAAPEAGAATNQWFWSTMSFRTNYVAPSTARDRRSGLATLTNVLNFGLCVQGSSTETTRSKIRTVNLPGFSTAAPTGVWARVSDVSYATGSSASHTCEVWLNGVKCGSSSWLGEQALTFDAYAAQGVVTNGPLQLKIRNGLTSSTYDFMLLDAWLTYPRRYEAVGDLLVCTGGDAGTVSVGGLTTNAVSVWDVTDPDAPCALDAPVWQETNGTWSTAFCCGGSETRYAVFGRPSGGFLAAVNGVRDTDWSSASEMPELAIVTPPRRWFSGFESAVQPLADFRNAQGLVTRIIDAEDIYNAFSGGLAHPAAFQRFCAAGVTNGASPRLRYLLFAGNGGSDYKLDAIGFGEKWPWITYFPIYLYPQADDGDYLLLPNDVALGNAAGSAVPEVAVGRFIATNALELTRMVNKTIGYETTVPCKRRGMFVSSTQLSGDTVDFGYQMGLAAESFSNGGWSPKTFYPDEETWGENALNVLWYNDSDDPATGVRVELEEGGGLLYYFGHSSDTMLGIHSSGSGCFVDWTALRSVVWPFTPLGVFIGCRPGRWTLYDFASQRQSLSEAAVRNPVSGFAAVVSASGYMMESEAMGFSNGFRNSVAAGALRLGDAWCAAFQKVGAADSSDLQHMTLLGDPAIVIAPLRTARGTPTDWLIEQGLTNGAYADLVDGDGDVFPVWQEYQAGTDYSVSNVFEVRQFAAAAGQTNVFSLAFQPQYGVEYRVVSTTNLGADAWAAVPWKGTNDESWSWSPILGDWPLKTVFVPAGSDAPARYYKVEPYAD